MTTMTTEQKSVGLGFWLQWTLASAVGLGVFGLLAVGLGWGLTEAIGKALGEIAGIIIGWAVGGALFGAGFGVGQAFALRGQIARPWQWVLASALGGAVCLAIMFSIVFSVFPEGTSDEGMAAQAAVGAMMGAGLGVSLGIAQWIVLRGQVARAGWWVLISLVGVALSMAVSIPLSGEGREFLSLSVGGLVAGALTGLPMLWLLRQSRP